MVCLGYRSNTGRMEGTFIVGVDVPDDREER